MSTSSEPLYELIIPVPDANASVRVRYARTPPSPELRTLFQAIDRQATPMQSFSNSSRFYVQLILEKVRWWDIEDDEGNMVPLTRSEIEQLPSFILKAITMEIVKAERLLRPEVIAIFQTPNAA